MAKAIKHSLIAAELKKEYLRHHLEYVKTLISGWMAELHPPEPLAPHDRAWGWQSIYRLPRQDNPDDNHILRHHLKSRVLWSHHNRWERKLEEIWNLIKQLRVNANDKVKKLSGNKRWKYTQEYAPLALWKAFDLALGNLVDLPFKIPDDLSGLSYGAFRIEESANTPDERSLIEEEYRSFIKSLSRSSTMKQIVRSWQEANHLEVQISTIANDTLKSNNIFYICRFCRPLWK